MCGLRRDGWTRIENDSFFRAQKNFQTFFNLLRTDSPYTSFSKYRRSSADQRHSSFIEATITCPEQDCCCVVQEQYSPVQSSPVQSSTVQYRTVQSRTVRPRLRVCCIFEPKVRQKEKKIGTITKNMIFFLATSGKQKRQNQNKKKTVLLSFFYVTL